MLRRVGVKAVGGARCRHAAGNAYRRQRAVAGHDRVAVGAKGEPRRAASSDVAFAASVKETRCSLLGSAGYGDPDRIRTDGLHRDRVAC